MSDEAITEKREIVLGCIQPVRFNASPEPDNIRAK
jgi:hypothetical protein